MTIVIDLASVPSTRSQRPTIHLIHYALIFKSLGHNVKVVVDDNAIVRPHVKMVSESWTSSRHGDIYISHPEAYAFDTNFELIPKNIYKVAITNADHTGYEINCKIDGVYHNAVPPRCDLYAPVNYKSILHNYQIISHAIDHRMVTEFIRLGIYNDYLNDNVNNIRRIFKNNCLKPLCFMGNSHPDRMDVVQHLPPWVEYVWKNNASSKEYLRYIIRYQGMLDIRGYGDKNIRLIEAAMFGKTIVTVRVHSQYFPNLCDDNCIIADRWCDFQDLEYSPHAWRDVASKATDDYISGWSVRSQCINILNKFKH